jgi:hypothetical protein
MGIETKEICYTFTNSDPALCDELYISTNDAEAAGEYSGNGSIESHEAFFKVEEIVYEKVVDRVRRRGHS